MPDESSLEDAECGARRNVIILLSTADWHTALWTNKQYMARELARRYDVVYVESIGIRTPRLTRADVRRVLRRLIGGSARRNEADVPAHVTIVSPRLIPWHNRLTRACNTALLLRLLSKYVKRRHTPTALLTYTPISYGLERSVDLAVYHCVDLLGEFPRIRADRVAEGERQLAGAGVEAIASSEVVAAHLSDVGFKPVLLWPNVADVERFQVASLPASGRRRLQVVFGGNVTLYKLDLALIRAVVEHPLGMEMIIAGPLSDGGNRPAREVLELQAHGVKLLGPLPLAELSVLFGESSVGIIPYALNGYTLGVNPLKLFEYFAAGLGVVSSGIPSVRSYASVIDRHHLRVESDPRSFAESVAELAVGLSDRQIAARGKISAEHSWTVRGVEAREFFSTRFVDASARRMD